MFSVRFIFILLFLTCGAAQTWSDPAQRLRPSGRDSTVSIASADSLIWHIVRTQNLDRFDEASHLYLYLLNQLDHRKKEDHAILLRLLWSTVIVLPADTRRGFGIEEVLEHSDLSRLPAGVGNRCVAWWRRNDSVAGTEILERLEEHLTRLWTAAQDFKDMADPRGFDDRGEIYVRFGAPAKKSTIDLNPMMLTYEFRNVPNIPRIPENEVWTYPHIDPSATYLFVRGGKGRAYRLGEGIDLIPVELQAGIGRSSSRQRQQTGLLLRLLEEIYGQLALLDRAYGSVYDEIAAYVGLPDSRLASPDQFAHHTLIRAQEKEYEVETLRHENVPASFAGLDGLTEKLPVLLRWARFLEPDGTTRTEFYWTLQSETLRPSDRLLRRLKREGVFPSEKYLLTLTASQWDSAFTSRSIVRRDYLMRTDMTGPLPPQTLVVQGDFSSRHITIQWLGRWTEENGERRDPGAWLKAGEVHLDTLQALNSRTDSLEMSDLMAVQYTKPIPEGRIPYPFSNLNPAVPLALYFEVYHLKPDTEGLNRYRVSYEVTRYEKRNGILAPVRSTHEVKTAAGYQASGTSSTAREYVMMDFSEQELSNPIEITVTVSDKVSGQQVEREIAFGKDK